MENKRLYRIVEAYQMSGIDGEPVSTQLKLEMRSYPVIRETKSGVWIQLFEAVDGFTGKKDWGHRFVRLTARKRFACETKAEAAASFLLRKRKQIKILRAQLENAIDAERVIIEKMTNDGELSDSKRNLAVLCFVVGDWNKFKESDYSKSLGPYRRHISNRSFETATHRVRAIFRNEIMPPEWRRQYDEVVVMDELAKQLV